MTNPVHLLTVAALLLVAFLVGATIGSLLRVMAQRAARKPAAIVEAPAEVVATAAPLVATPVIAPLPIAPTPAPPAVAEVPVPDFAATLIALANEAPPAAFLEAVRARPEPAGKPQAAPPDLQLALVADAAATAPAMQPARVAGETTSGLQVAAPLHENPVDAPAEPTGPRTADVISFPVSAPEPSVEKPTDAAEGARPGAVSDTPERTEVPAKEDVVSSEVLDASVGPVASDSAVAEDDLTIVGWEAHSAPTAEVEPPAVVEVSSDTEPVPAVAADVPAATVAVAELPVSEVVIMTATPQPTPEAKAEVVREPSVVEALPAPTAGPARQQESAANAEPIPQPEPQPEPIAPAADAAWDEQTSAPVGPAPSFDEPMDEDAAMRAIEGNWTPRRPPVRRPRPVEAPEGVNQAVAASARAVTAARRTAEAVIAEVAEAHAEVKAEAGRPVGLDQPRDGRKDELSHIIGVLPVIETALNALGIYHFDQIGALSDENIGWIEAHLGVPGRIGRELWREQARELSAVLRPKRAAEN